jgi:23S rRNA pseudouridine2605 synthase
MVEAVGNRVVRLRRIAFGPLKIGNLKEGDSRRLNATEIQKLQAASDGREGAARSGARGRPSPPNRQ